jgi:hypothetical protein
MARTDATERQALRRTSRKLRRLRGDLRTLAASRPVDLTAAQQRQAIVLLADAVLVLNQRLNLLAGDTDADDRTDPGD